MYPQVFGKYVLERELARGGMARVVLATLKGAGGFEKKLVVKQIRDELAWDDAFVKRFVDEAKTTVALSHPNIVPVYELGVELGTYYLAMEYVEGVSTADLLKAAARDTKLPLSPEQGAYVGVEICRALDYAHRRMKVVHRDITPRNVMVDEEGQVKVIDFGIAALASVGGMEVFGSPGHMPPEQIEGKELTPATDVFAVAVLLLELWSGKAPFRRKDPKESEEALRASRPKPSEIDIRLLPLDDVFARAIALDPAARPQEADELGRVLRKFLAGIDIHDLARELGDRVRELRARPLVPANTKRQSGLERPASKPSAATIRTKTFAAREEVKVWAPGDETERTRRMPTSEPPRTANATAATAAATATGPAAGDIVETQATRPIESGPRGEGANPRRRAGLAVFAGVALVVAAGGAVVVKAINAGVTPTPIATTSSTMATASGSATASSVPTITADTATAPVESTSAPPAASTAPASAPDAALLQRATLILQGDPGTVVAVDGASRGPCPTEASVTPGTHYVLFTFPATSEAAGSNVTVKPGEKTGLRAAFTGASPTVSVWKGR